MNVILWSILLRTGQFAIESSTTVLCGLLVAGVMRYMLGAEGTCRLFGGGGYKGLFRAWAVGTVLPVCSLGVIPIALEMRRAGVRSGTILAFVMAAPHINPLSLLYGLTLSEPLVVICFALGSLGVALVAGATWDCFLAAKDDAVSPSGEVMPAPGLKRLVAVSLGAARDATSPAMLYILIGLVSTGLVAGLLPFGCLGRTMRHEDWVSPLLMSVLAIPIYLGPLQGMMRLGLMFEHGNSVGAAFALFELGIGLNLGMLVWLMKQFGWRRTLVWLGLITTATLALAYASERPLYYAYEEVSHTHAFDDWSSPFPPGYSVDWEIVRDKLLQKIEVLEPVALSGLGLLILVGLLARKLDPEQRLEAWLARQPPVPEDRRGLLGWYVPGFVLGLIALGGLVVFSVVGLYIYYPTPTEAFAEIVHVRADAVIAVNTGHKEEAIRQIQQWDLLTRKLQVGIFLRTGRIDPEATRMTEDLRERLEDVRDDLLANKVEEAKARLPRLEDAYRKCRAAYRNSGAIDPM